VINPHGEAVLIRNSGTNLFEDKTRDVSSYEFQAGSRKIDIAFNGKSKVFSYGLDRVQVLRRPARRNAAGFRCLTGCG
jgi:hypothetical protein